jgi:membrane dipeptidase
VIGVRLIDLHCTWALQYAGETTQYDPALYSEVPSRLGQLDGYLSGVSAALLACGRRPEDWARRASAWETLGEMIARYEAEFSGRLLLGPADAARWRDEPADALCWGVLAIEGLDFLVRTPDDLDRLPWLFARGVRVFQLLRSNASLLGGADSPGDDRGLTDLGRAILERLANLDVPARIRSAVPLLDIADLNGRSIGDVLSWFEADPSHGRRLVLARTRGGQLGKDHLKRFRALGGFLGLTVGPPHAASPAALREAIESAAELPLVTQPGYDGIGLATDFPNLEPGIVGLENPCRITEWLAREFPPVPAAAIAQQSAGNLLVRLIGSPDPLAANPP